MYEDITFEIAGWAVWKAKCDQTSLLEDDALASLSDVIIIIRNAAHDDCHDSAIVKDDEELHVRKRQKKDVPIFAKINAHSTVLAQRSRYFRSALTNGFPCRDFQQLIRMSYRYDYVTQSDGATLMRIEDLVRLLVMANSFEFLDAVADILHTLNAKITDVNAACLIFEGIPDSLWTSNAKFASVLDKAAYIIAKYLNQVVHGTSVSTDQKKHIASCRPDDECDAPLLLTDFCLDYQLQDIPFAGLERALSHQLLSKMPFVCTFIIMWADIQLHLAGGGEENRRELQLAVNQLLRKAQIFESLEDTTCFKIMVASNPWIVNADPGITLPVPRQSSPSIRQQRHIHVRAYFSLSACQALKEGQAIYTPVGIIDGYPWAAKLSRSKEEVSLSFEIVGMSLPEDGDPFYQVPHPLFLRTSDMRLGPVDLSDGGGESSLALRGSKDFTPGQYEISFFRPKGVALSTNIGNYRDHVVIMGFRNNPDGVPGVIESQGIVKENDVLIGVNGEPVRSLGFSKTVHLIGNVIHDVTFRFVKAWAREYYFNSGPRFIFPIDQPSDHRPLPTNQGRPKWKDVIGQGSPYFDADNVMCISFKMFELRELSHQLYKSDLS